MAELPSPIRRASPSNQESPRTASTVSRGDLELAADFGSHWLTLCDGPGWGFASSGTCARVTAGGDRPLLDSRYFAIMRVDAFSVDNAAVQGRKFTLDPRSPPWASAGTTTNHAFQARRGLGIFPRRIGSRWVDAVLIWHRCGWFWNFRLPQSNLPERRELRPASTAEPRLMRRRRLTSARSVASPSSILRLLACDFIGRCGGCVAPPRRSIPPVILSATPLRWLLGRKVELEIDPGCRSSS